MASPTESNVQLPGGTQTGPQVRTTQLYVLDSGVLTPVQVQVVQVADEQGNILGDPSDYDIMAQVLMELRAIRRLLATNLGQWDAIAETSVMGPSNQ